MGLFKKKVKNPVTKLVVNWDNIKTVDDVKAFLRYSDLRFTRWHVEKQKALNFLSEEVVE